ncbi:hypothetical protein vseg_001961 [Gypsophila vaccaria]
MMMMPPCCCLAQVEVLLPSWIRVLRKIVKLSRPTRNATFTRTFRIIFTPRYPLLHRLPHNPTLKALPGDEAKIQEMQDKIDKLTTMVKQLMGLQKAEAENAECRLKDEAEKASKKIQSLEARLTASHGYSIHQENEYMPRSLRAELPEKLILSDLLIFKGTENLIVHIGAFKDQVAIKGVNLTYWPMLFPHSLASFPKGWFYVGAGVLHS